ncbi:unnamed protein product [Phytomonas sp. Hart1]|nr:unnamed protein product [Phytomonas sp. Hart1]|eukprot:CCW72266.1 unnamed protein product [Phytomonas sp. isolate Hart1]
MPPKTAVKRGNKPKPKDTPAASLNRASSLKSTKADEVGDEAQMNGQEIWLATDALQKTKAMRNYFQLERDRISAFWDISKKQLDGVKENLRQKNQEKLMMVDRHEVEKKIFEQKIRHLLYENQLQLSSSQEEAERALVEKQEEYRQIESNAMRDVRDVKLLNREMEVRQMEQRMTLAAQQDKDIAEQQARFERESKKAHLKYEQMLKFLREEMDHARIEEIRQLENRKELHVAELCEMHDRTFKEVKDYFREITSNNLETIRALKDEVFARKRTEAHNEKAMHEVAHRNKKLTVPFVELQRRKKELEAVLVNYNEDKEKLLILKSKAKETDQEYQKLSWENEVLGQRYAKLVEDRDIILNKYNQMLQDIQKKSTFRRVLLQKKLEVVQSQLEGRDAKLTDLLKRANLSEEDIRRLGEKVHDLVSEKEKAIENLEQLLMRMAERYEDIRCNYESYLENNATSIRA